MGAEAAAASAEIAARFGHLKIGYDHGMCFDRHVDEPGHLLRLLALIEYLLVDDHDDVAHRALRALGEFGDWHFRHRERGVRAVEWRHVEPADFGIAQIFRRRLLRPVEELVAVDNLHDAAFVGAVAEIDAVAPRAERDRAVQLGRYRPGGAGLLAGQAEIADLDRMRRVAEVPHFGHPVDAPARHAGDQISDPGVAFPK